MKINQLHRQQGEIKSSCQHLPALAGMGENKALSKLNSGLASRQSLAFFVSKHRAASQATDTTDATHLAQFTGLNRHIFDMPTFQHIASYGGVTLQNKPYWRICRAVTVKTESEPHHPMRLHGVVSTQNLAGGHNHA